MQKEQEIYTLTALAKLLKVPRQTIYYWIEKGWVKPKRDYRDYPVFTDEDVKKILEWKTAIK
jgi:DNA-binding transcriptional MerR regulator